MIKGIVNGCVDGSLFLAVSTQIDFNEIGTQLLIAVGIVIIHIVIQPLLTWLFNKIKDKIKSKQKTPENDGELADKVLEVVENVEDKINDKLDDIVKGGNSNERKQDGKEDE